jgi:hypothetical protein
VKHRRNTASAIRLGSDRLRAATFVKYVNVQAHPVNKRASLGRTLIPAKQADFMLEMVTVSCRAITKRQQTIQHAVSSSSLVGGSVQCAFVRHWHSYSTQMLINALRKPECDDFFCAGFNLEAAGH